MKRTTTYSILLTAALFGLFSTAKATPTQFTFGREVKYAQSDTSTVALYTENAYRANVDVQEDSSTSVFSAGVLTLSDNSTLALSYSSDDQEWFLQDKTSSLDTLNSDVPIGSYSLAMTKVAGGTTTIPFTISSLTFPTTPVISNYTALQSIDATSELTISWATWSAGTSSDFITIRIENASNGNTVYSLDPGDTDALSGTATSVTIPADTLTSGTSYKLDIQFITGTTYSASGAISDYPSAMKAVYNATSTSMTINTSGSSVENIFEDLTHETNSWIAPSGTVADSFGWICDLFYPWIYNASQDILTNGTYQGDGDGWMYIYPNGATLSGGFYIYRYATSTWAYANYNWYGWIYDYGTSSWIDITPVE